MRIGWYVVTRNRVLCQNCVKYLLKPSQIPWFTGTLQCTSLLREVVDLKCVGGIRCASARVTGINFQACLIDRSSISPFRINDLRTVWN
jgi:hypothetical protein